MPIRVFRSWSNGILIEAAESFGRQYPESLFIGPRRLAGESLAGRKGSLGVHHVSVAQAAREMARERMADAGLAPVGVLGIEALSARVVHRARGSLRYFDKIETLPGFARALARTLTELRLARVEAAKLEGDLARLLLLYEEELTERSLADHAAVLDLAAAAARHDAHRWLGLPLVSMDVAAGTAAQREFLAAVESRAPEVLRCELGAGETGASRDSSLESGTSRDSSLVSGASRDSSLDHLRANLFETEPKSYVGGDGRFEYFSAPGEGLEAVEIARRILKLAREGVPFDDAAIFLRNPERYQPMVEDALRRARIPAYFSRGTRRPDPSGRAFLALLGCAAENYSASRFAEYLSLAQVPEVVPAATWVPPQDEALAEPESNDEADAGEEAEAPPEPSKPTPYRWERLLVDAAVIGGRDRWQRRLDGLEAEWRLQDQAHDQPRERIEHLHNLRSFALPLIDFLAALPQGSAWGAWVSALEDLARRSLRVPDGVLAALAELAPMAEVGPVSLEEVVEVLSDRLRFLRSEPPARRWGRVFVGSVEEARGRAFDVVFVPGLAEGLFPRRPSEDPLLLDDVRRVVDEALPTRHGRVEEERDLLRLALAAARDRVIASYPRMEVAEARPRVPSFYALELPRALEGALPELKRFEEHARDAAPARLNWPAPREAAEAIDDAEYDLVAIGQARHTGRGGSYLVDVNPHLARSLRGRWYRWNAKWWPADGLIATDAAAVEALAAYRLKARAWSPSSLETFAACPYKFALRGIYRLREREEAAPLQQLDPLTRGLLFHKIQEEWFKGPRTRERLEEVIEQVAAEWAEKLAPAIERVWQSEIGDLRTDLRGWLDFIEANEADWEPERSEYEFKEAALDGVLLRGKIDLIERHKTRGVYRITDHKTGKRPEMVPRWVGGGKHLQPILYSLAAERELGIDVEAGRLLYATQKGGYVPVEIPFDARARQFAERLLADIDAAIEAGFLPPAPEKEACALCDYRIVCGPYEEQRLLKKDRRDERLDGLYEIRGMA